MKLTYLHWNNKLNWNTNYSIFVFILCTQWMVKPVVTDFYDNNILQFLEKFRSRLKTATRIWLKVFTHKCQIYLWLHQSFHNRAHNSAYLLVMSLWQCRFWRGRQTGTLFLYQNSENKIQQITCTTQICWNLSFNNKFHTYNINNWAGIT